MFILKENLVLDKKLKINYLFLNNPIWQPAVILNLQSKLEFVSESLFIVPRNIYQKGNNFIIKLTRTPF